MFAAGSTVERREVLHGEVWLSFPLTVVRDDGVVLAARLDPGAPMSFPDHPFGLHPWHAHAAWSESTVLHLYREGDWYALWRMFHGDHDLGWYVNFEAPIVRGPRWIDTVDYGIDIVIPPDEPWHWKDADDIDDQLRSGRIDDVTAARIRTEADAMAEVLNVGDRWWQPWDDWTPARCGE